MPRRAEAKRVLLVDGCSTFRVGLAHALAETKSLQVHAEAGTAAEALQGSHVLEADVAVVDVDLPDMHGIQVCKELLARRPGISVLMLSFWDWDVYLAAAQAAGASGFLLRFDSTRNLVRAIRMATARQIFAVPQLERIQNWERSVGSQLRTLGPREWEVLWCVATGLSNREIANALVLSENTAEKHVSAILRKLNLPSRAALLAFVLEHHLTVLNGSSEWQ